jgi:hypothetical protein
MRRTFGLPLNAAMHIYPLAMISKARQGNAAMHIYPLAKLWSSGPKKSGKRRKASGASPLLRR